MTHLLLTHNPEPYSKRKFYTVSYGISHLGYGETAEEAWAAADKTIRSLLNPTAP